MQQSPKSARCEVALNAESPKYGFLDTVTRFYHELVPWGDPSKGFGTPTQKREAMIANYMKRTGYDMDKAAKDVDEYLADKEGYIIRKTQEEQAKNKKK